MQCESLYGDYEPQKKDSTMTNFEVMDNRNYGGGIVKMWTKGVPVEDAARNQLINMSKLPFIHKHISVMPDVHLGKGATIGSVIPTKKAIIPAACGVDIGCGICAMRTSLTSHDLPDTLKPVRSLIESAVPHGRSKSGGGNDKGSWRNNPPGQVMTEWRKLEVKFKEICDKYPHLEQLNHVMHLGTLGTGNHFIELCLDEEDRVWVMLHSGSRGIGNAIGRLFIEKAKKEMERWHIHLPDTDLSYLVEGSDYFDDYWESLKWAQDFARINREIMMNRVLDVMRRFKDIPGFKIEKKAINCHHNYVDKENHFGSNVFVTRKGAIRARVGDLGIIPGSMGAKSFIVEGKGNADSFNSCSHGAGRKMSRNKAKELFTLDDHIEATKGVECRKDEDVIDETPMAYKSIDDVMEAQKDLVDIKHTLKQFLCVKG